MNEIKKIFLYAIVPALIAGIFAVSPKLYDELTEPKAVLEYVITKGPMLKGPDGNKAILAVDIINNGKKPLSGVVATIRTNSEVTAISSYESTGLSPKINPEPMPPTVTVETLHPGERFTISMMVVDSSKNNEIDITLRSKEVLGSKINPTDTKKEKTSDILSAAAASMSVFVMAAFFMSRLKKGKALGPFLSYKQDILFYIAATLNLKSTLKKYGDNEGDITFLRFGDMLYAVARDQESCERDQAILGLKCLLLNKDMAEVSKKMIIRNIKSLEDDQFSQEEIDLIVNKSVGMSEIEEIRDAIDSYVESPASFLTSTSESNKGSQ